MGRKLTKSHWADCGHSLHFARVPVPRRKRTFLGPIVCIESFGKFLKYSLLGVLQFLHAFLQSLNDLLVSRFDPVRVPEPKTNPAVHLVLSDPRSFLDFL